MGRGARRVAGPSGWPGPPRGHAKLAPVLATIPPRRGLATRATPATHAGDRAIGWRFFTLLALASAIAAVLLYWPVGPLDGTHLPAGATGDPAQAVWFLAWTPFALGHGLNPFETGYLYAPGHVDLADNTFMPLLGLLGGPVTVLLGPVASFNLLLRAAYVLSTVAMAAFLREVCTSRRAVAVGSLLYGFSPFLMTEGFGDAHLNLAFVPFPPLLAWCALRAVRGTARWAGLGAVAGLLLAAQAYVAPDVVATLGVVAVAGVVALALAPRVRRRTDWRKGLGTTVVAGAVFAVAAGPLLYWSVAGPGHLSGAVEQPKFLQAYHGDLLGPVVPTARQLLAPPSLLSMSSRFAAANPTEHVAYLGVPLALLLVVIGARFWRDSLVRFGVLLGLVAFVFSLGPALSVANRTTGVPLPETVLAHLPLLDSTVPARFALEALLCSALVVARGVDLWLSAWRRRTHPLRPALLATALLACALTLLPSFSAPELATGSTDVGPVLRGVPPGAVVLAYPYPKTPYNAPMVWAAQDGMGFRLLGGYAIAKGPDGDGVMSPPLLDPPAVQEYLVALENKGVPLYYPGPPGGRATPAELCTFLVRYHVAEVLLARRTAGSAAARRLVVDVLGRPARVSRAFESWRVPSRRSC